MLNFFIGIVLYDAAYNIQFFWKKWQRLMQIHASELIYCFIEFYQIIEEHFFVGNTFINV